MIEYKTGDLFAEDVDAFVNSVNCVGIMGRGIALQFKMFFPNNFKAYADACRRGEVTPGRLFIFETGELANPRYIINFPTKRHWRGKSRIEDIESGLDAEKPRMIRAIAVSWSALSESAQRSKGGLCAKCHCRLAPCLVTIGEEHPKHWCQCPLRASWILTARPVPSCASG